MREYHIMLRKDSSNVSFRHRKFSFESISIIPFSLCCAQNLPTFWSGVCGATRMRTFSNHLVVLDGLY